jgi:hypothetical protein
MAEVLTSPHGSGASQLLAESSVLISQLPEDDHGGKVMENLVDAVQGGSSPVASAMRLRIVESSEHQATIQEARATGSVPRLIRQERFAILQAPQVSPLVSQQQLEARIQSQIQPASKPKPKVSRKERLAIRLQYAYRCHLGRRMLRRLRKLKVFFLETSAAITMQCFFRVRLAHEQVRRKRALAYYKRFMLTTRPSLCAKRWTEAEMEQLAAIYMQAAWRRRKAYFARKRAQNMRPFLNRMKAKLGVESLTNEEIERLAATYIQTKFRQRSAYFLVKRRAQEFALGRENSAAVKMQALWRGKRTRKEVKEQQSNEKFRRLGHFLTNACFVKCFVTWHAFALESKDNKRVIGKVISRLLNRHVYMCLTKLADYAKHQQQKRIALVKVAGHLGYRDDHTLQLNLCAWASLLQDNAVVFKAVQAKMAKFLGLGDKAMIAAVLHAWHRTVADNKKALFKWTHSGLVHAFRALKDMTQIERANRQLLARISKQFLCRESILLLRMWHHAAQDFAWAKHLLVHHIWAYENREIAVPFSLLLEHAQHEIKARAITARLATRFKYRVAMHCLRLWHEEAAAEAERRTKCRQLIFRLKHHHAHGCLLVWKEFVHDVHIKARETMCGNSAFLVRWLKRPMACCFHAWEEHVAEQVAYRGKIRKMLYRISNAAVVSTFEHWVQLKAILREERRAHLRLAVGEALMTGSLAEVLHMAKSQPKVYRDCLEQVMQEQ